MSIIVPPDDVVARMAERAERLLPVRTVIGGYDALRHDQTEQVKRALLEAWTEGVIRGRVTVEGV